MLRRKKEGNKCPQNGTVKQVPWVDATGCTKEEALRKLNKKLLDAAKDARDEIHSPCTGSCDKGKRCILLASYDDTLIRCSAAALPECPDGVGYYCYFSGNITAECSCGPNPIL